jgi:hypothetical protein
VHGFDCRISLDAVDSLDAHNIIQTVQYYRFLSIKVLHDNIQKSHKKKQGILYIYNDYEQQHRGAK